MGTDRPVRMVWLVIILLSGVVAVPGRGAAAAAVHSPPDPSVLQPVPAPGEATAAGAVTVGAMLWTTKGVGEAELRVDGVVHPHALHAPGGGNRELRANVRLGHGHHRIEVRFVDGDGRAAARGWWIGTSDLAISRVAGTDRVETAVAVSQRSYPRSGSAPAAILSRADGFADALGGAPLAAQVDGPLLLSATDALSGATARELARVVAPGGEVHLLGGKEALSERVAQQIRGLGLAPTPHAGPDRYATAVAVAELIPESSTAIVASAWSFPDALAASAPAARDGVPILLTAPDGIPAVVEALLAERDFDQVHVIGGPAVVGDAVLRRLDAVAGTVQRVWGADRYATAAAVEDRFYDDVRTVLVANGERFPDALTGGPHAATLGAPVMLSPRGSLAPPQVTGVAKDRPSRAVLLGGPAALEHELEDDLRRAHLGSSSSPLERAFEPPPGTALDRLIPVSIRFDRSLDGIRTSLYLTMDGVEVPGHVEVSGNRLTFHPAHEPVPLRAGGIHQLRLVVAAHADGGWRHLEYTLWLRGPQRSAPGVVTVLPEDGASGVQIGERAVALTFDDGPSPTYTPQVLDILDRYGAVGTFFVTGSLLDRYPEIARDAVARGHVVSNHTMTHSDLRGLSDERFAAEVDRTTRRIMQVTGQGVHCVRPPYGAYDSHVVSRLAGRGLHTALWSIDPRDWQRPGANEIVRRTLSELHPGAVVVLHDGGLDRRQLIEALPRILDGIRAAGYRTAPLCG